MCGAEGGVNDVGLRDAEVDGMYTISGLETFIMRARSSWVLDTVQGSEKWGYCSHMPKVRGEY